MELVSPIKIGGKEKKEEEATRTDQHSQQLLSMQRLPKIALLGSAGQPQQHPTSPAPLHLPAQRRADDGFVPSALLGSRAGLLAVKCSIF